MGKKSKQDRVSRCTSRKEANNGRQVDYTFRFDPYDSTRNSLHSHRNDGQPEFIAWNILEEQKDHVISIFSFLSERQVKDGDYIESYGLHLLARKMDRKKKKLLIKDPNFEWKDPKVTIFEILSRFDVTDSNDVQQNNWGEIPVPSNGRLELIERIVDEQDSKKATVTAIFANPTGLTCSFICSHCNDGGPEFIACNVPKRKAAAVAYTFEFLKTRQVKNGDRITCRGVSLLARKMDREEKASMFDMCSTLLKDPTVELFELVPRYEVENIDDPKRSTWGEIPTPPNGRCHLVESIIREWRKQEGFLMYIDGNISNNHITNVKFVDLAVALRNMDDWTVDWDKNLSPEQIQYVCSHPNYFIKIARHFRGKLMCNFCGKISQDLMLCGRCKCAWYCCYEHQESDWSNHKEDCKQWKHRRNSKPGKIGQCNM